LDVVVNGLVEASLVDKNDESTVSSKFTTTSEAINAQNKFKVAGVPETDAEKATRAKL
jgi:hypothetical protein